MIILYFIIYQLAQIILFPFILLYIAWLQSKKNVIGNWRHRLGFVPRNNSHQPTMWFHAVSVGEMLAVQEMMRTIKQKKPNTFIYLTVGTVGAYTLATEQKNADLLAYVPYDFFFSILLTYSRIKPSTLILVEAELWPNLIWFSQLYKIPLYSLNARINQRSAPRMLKARFFLKTLLTCFKHIFLQHSGDIAIFKQLGAKDQQISVMGNIKAWNVREKRLGLEPTTTTTQPLLPFTVILAGSVHPTEDAHYINAFKKLKITHPNLRLIIAPRHFTWKAELAQHVHDAGLTSTMWDDEHPLKQAGQDLTSALTSCLKEHDVLLVCKLGELFGLYPYAHIFGLGGTFVPVGGHNLLEPAAWGIPALVGPHNHHCSDIIAKLEAVNGVVTVNAAHEVEAHIAKLLDDKPLHAAIAQSSRLWLEDEAVRVEKTVQTLIAQL
jgi:3-deoxy-D-manno-octulosonic-acid transferase